MLIVSEPGLYILKRPRQPLQLFQLAGMIGNGNREVIRRHEVIGRRVAQPGGDLKLVA